MVKACGEMGLDPDDAFCLKCVQMKELLDIRHCVFLMGPAAAGKSECWRILAKARELMGPELKTGIWDVNPKAVETQELYGYISMATKSGRTGYCRTVMRNIGAIPDELPKWIMLDGDLDANWIESMNSVMDDNRMLTLASDSVLKLNLNLPGSRRWRRRRGESESSTRLDGIVPHRRRTSASRSSPTCAWSLK